MGAYSIKTRVASNGLELGNLWKPLETHGNPLETLLETPGNPSRNPAETLPEAFLITEVELAPPRLPTKSAACKEGDKTVRLLEPRCQAASFFARWQGAVQKWSDNGGHLTHALSEPDDAGLASDILSPVVLHKVFES